MRRQGPLTLRHLVVTGLVVVIVLMQLIWWTLFTMRESQARLHLEHDRLTAASRQLADQVSRCLQAAENELQIELMNRESTGSGGTSWQLHFSTVDQQDGEPCTAGWFQHQTGITLQLPSAHGCMTGALRPIEQWLDAPQDVVISPELAGTPGVALPPPFAGLFARPSLQRWQAALDDHHGRLRMFLSEGTFFVVLVLILVGLLWKTVRRDMELEHQHRNFISAITHELKSPLAAVRLSLETVLHGRADNDAGERFLKHALLDIERLEGLVQKVLEVTRYGLGDAALRLDRADVSEVVNAVAETFKRRATASGATLTVEVQRGITARVDTEAFAIVVSNLLENAIKYGGTAPDVRLSLRLLEGNARLEVRDSGSGISGDDLPFIFDRFFRGEEEMTRTTRGTGLGLYLVRQIVSAHGGSVEVVEAGARGTTLRVVVPEAELMEETP